MEIVQDLTKTKSKPFGRNKSVNSIDVDVNDINFLFDKKLSNAEKMSLLHLRKQKTGTKGNNSGRQGYTNNNNTTVNHNQRNIPNLEQVPSQTHRNYTANNSMLIEKNYDSAKNRDTNESFYNQQANHTNQQNPQTNMSNSMMVNKDSLKLPTNQINPNDFYQKTLNKHKKNVSPQKHPPNYQSYSKGAGLSNVNHQNNINSARVDNRGKNDQPHNMIFHKKRFSNKFEKGTYNLHDNEEVATNNKNNSSMTNSQQKNEYIKNYIVNDRVAGGTNSNELYRNVKARGTINGQSQVENNQQQIISSKANSRESRKKNVVTELGQSSSSLIKNKTDKNRNESYIEKPTKKDSSRQSTNNNDNEGIHKEGSYKSNNRSATYSKDKCNNLPIRDLSTQQQTNLSKVFDKRRILKGEKSAANDNNHTITSQNHSKERSHRERDEEDRCGVELKNSAGVINQDSNYSKLFERKNQSYPVNLFEQNGERGSVGGVNYNYNLQQNKNGQPFQYNSGLHDHRINDIQFNSPNGPRNQPKAAVLQQNYQNLNNKRFPTPPDTGRQVSQVYSSDGDKISNQKDPSSPDFNRRKSSKLSKGGNSKKVSPKCNRSKDNGKKSDNEQNDISLTDLKKRQAKDAYERNIEDNGSDDGISDNEGKCSKKEKLAARFNGKRSSLPDNGIYNKLANELKVPINFKQCSMTPDASRNVSPVCSSKKSN